MKGQVPQCFKLIVSPLFETFVPPSIETIDTTKMAAIIWNFIIYFFQLQLEE